MSAPALREVPTKSQAAVAVERHGYLGAAMRWAAPQIFMRRAQARLRLSAFETLEKHLSTTPHQGASKSRGYANWDPSDGSADVDLLSDLPLLRARSRDIIRNDPHAAGMVETWVQQIIGTGLKPQSRIDAKALGISPLEARDLGRQIEEVYDEWAECTDVTGQLTACELQALQLRQIFENGDVFIIPRQMPVTSERLWGLAAEIVEADRITTPAKELTNYNIREGVEVGSMGEPTAYFIKKTHPGDILGFKQDFVKVPPLSTDGRRQVFHLFRTMRPGQSRGSPALSAALRTFRDMSQYMQAELTAAKVTACYALFIITQDPYGMAEQATARTENGRQVEMLEPGLIRRLGIGEDIKDFSPNRPATAFDPFLVRCIRAIGVSISTPYEIAAQDFSQTNYSSGRMALTEVRRIYTYFQWWLARKFCQPFFVRLIEEAVLTGRLRIRDYFARQRLYTRAFWGGQGWAWVDPQKEVGASRDALDSNLTTLAQELSSRGLDWEEVLDQRKMEKDKEVELGIAPQPKPSPFPGQSPGGNPSTPDGGAP